MHPRVSNWEGDRDDTSRDRFCAHRTCACSGRLADCGSAEGGGAVPRHFRHPLCNPHARYVLPGEGSLLRIEFGSAITVDANDVTIDLDGHRLSCEAGPASRAVGIFSSQCSAVTIRNGSVQGFHFGAQICGVNCRDNQVCNVTFEDNWYIGLWIEGKQSLALSNRV